MSFPREFVWGAATAAFQIEGATEVDGRGESIWDRFARTPGKVANGDTGEPGCQHYFRWREDLDLMRSLGLQGYRFSISWPRIQPDGRGPANSKGLDFYRRLVEGLREREIAPLATLYHWDLPQALEDEGGWASRDTVERFAEYAELVFDGLGEVDAWVTHNEPWVSAFLGYAYGSKAPGVRDWQVALAASHHLLLSHGRVVEAFRESGRPGLIGITLDLTEVYGEPEAALRLDGHRNRWFLDPLLRGGYPADMVDLYEEHLGALDFIERGDLSTIAQPLDFLGVNFYQPAVVRPGDEQPLRVELLPADGRTTAMGWRVEPDSLTALLLRLKRDYGEIPLVITENGASFDDPPLDGKPVIEDPDRVAYLREHVAAVERAIESGVDVRGYYVWSLFDNFEWEHGYSSRFGIVHVDFDSQRRTPKRSSLWYRDLIARQQNGARSG